jgi:hypothetical protein
MHVFFGFLRGVFEEFWSEILKGVFEEFWSEIFLRFFGNLLNPPTGGSPLTTATYRHAPQSLFENCRCTLEIHRVSYHRPPAQQPYKKGNIS